MRKALFILGSLSDLDVDWLIENGSKEKISANQVLIGQGEAVSSLYFITQGEFAVTNPKQGNKEIARLKSGEVVGEMSFIDSSPPSASVVAKQDSTVLAIPREDLADHLKDDTGFASRFYYALAVFLSDRLRKTVKSLGYGEHNEDDDDMGDEIDLGVMDNLHLAGARFDTIMRRLSEI